MKPIFLMSFSVLSVSSFAAPVDLAQVSAGVWSDHRGTTPPLRSYSFASLPAIAFWGGTEEGSWKWQGGIPLQWTRKEAEETTTALAVTDLTLSAGPRWNSTTARLGFVVPVGYQASDNEPWRGAGSLRLVLGAGSSRDDLAGTEGWDWGWDLEAIAAVTDGAHQAGSWQLNPLLKVDWMPLETWRFNATLSGSLSSDIWGEGADPSRTGRVLSTLKAEHFFPGTSLSLGLQAGTTLFEHETPGSSTASLALSWYR